MEKSFDPGYSPESGNAGFDVYLTKPIDVTHLMEVMGRLLETNQRASLKVSRR